MKAFSKEWIEAIATALKNDQIYQEKAKGFDSSYQFIVTADPGKGITQEFACGINLPQCDQTWVGIKANTDFVMSAPYGIFRRIITGDLGAVMAITGRKARIKGNLAKLAKYNGATSRFNEILKGIPTEFPGG